MKLVKDSYVNTSSLHDIRLKRGLTQDELGKKVGTKPNYNAKVERGETIPSLKLLKKIAKALGVKSQDILSF